MAALRNLAISLLRLAGHTNTAQALRHHARHPNQAIVLATNPIADIYTTLRISRATFYRYVKTGIEEPT